MSNLNEKTLYNHGSYVDTSNFDNFQCDTFKNIEDSYDGTTGLSDSSIYTFYRLLLPETDLPESYRIKISSLGNLNYDYIKNNFINTDNQSDPFPLLKDGDIISIDNNYCTIYSKTGDDYYPWFLCPTSYLNESDNNKYIDFVFYPDIVFYPDKKTYEKIFKNEHNKFKWHSIKDASFINNKNKDIVIFVNGIMNNQRDVIIALKLLRNRTSKNVMAIYNATAILNESNVIYKATSFVLDLVECFKDRDLDTRANENKATDTVIKILKILEPQNYIQTIYLVAHSQGSLITRNAIWEMKEYNKLFSKLVVITAGRAVGGETLNGRHWLVGPSYLHIQDVRDPISNLLAGGATISYKIDSDVFGFSTTDQNVFDKKMYTVKRSKESKTIFLSHHWHEQLFIGERKGVSGDVIKGYEYVERNIQNVGSFLYDGAYKLDASKIVTFIHECSIHSHYHTFSLSYIDIVSKIIKDNYKAFCHARLSMHAFVLKKRTTMEFSEEPGTWIISENDIQGVIELIASLTGPEKHSSNKKLLGEMLKKFFPHREDKKKLLETIYTEADTNSNSTIGNLYDFIRVVDSNSDSETASTIFSILIETILSEIVISEFDTNMVLSIFKNIKNYNVCKNLIESISADKGYHLLNESSQDYGEKFGAMIKTKKLGNAKIVAFNKYIGSVLNNDYYLKLSSDNANKILDLIIASESKVIALKIYNNRKYWDNLCDQFETNKTLNEKLLKVVKICHDSY